jgi:nucleoside phosphorylase
LTTTHADIAIITALRVELTAVLNRLDSGYVPIHLPGEALTFYRGTISVPDGTKSFSVVVTQLIEMGVCDAALATATVIRIWSPCTLFMVGIAGGVKDKVGLGDVIVSQFAYYYEPGKATTEGFEPRGRQHESDRLLYSRAQHYERTDWKGDINAPRPGGTEILEGTPRAHFGPIACGEKVIADLAELKSIRLQCPRMLGVAMEGAGVAKAISNQTRQCRFLEIRGVSDYAGPEKNDDWHEYAANSAAAFTIGFIRSDSISVKPNAENPNESVTLVISIQSLRTISKGEIIPALSNAAKPRVLNYFSLDFTDLVEHKKLIDPENAVQRLLSSQSALKESIERVPDTRLVFLGLAAIPLVVLAGHLISDRQLVQLFDFHPDDGSWKWPGLDSYPSLKRSGITPSANAGAGIAVIRMPISYHIEESHILSLRINPSIFVNLEHPNVERGTIKSEEQVRDYGRIFRQTIDEIVRIMPDCERIHLFYAGPMALAFHIGQQISENIHPPFTVWNYSRTYEWGLEIDSAVAGRPCIEWPVTDDSFDA